MVARNQNIATLPLSEVKDVQQDLEDIRWGGNAFLDLSADIVLSAAYHFRPPFYLLDQQSIVSRINWVRTQFDGFKLFFPFKSCPIAWVRRLVMERGFGVDLASASEWKSWIDISSEGNKVIYNTPSPEPNILRELIIKEGTFVIHDINDVKLSNEISKDMETKIKVLLRINHPSEGQSWSRFGVPSDDAINLAKIICSKFRKNVSLQGIHFHLGTNIRSLNIYSLALKKTLDIFYDISSQTDAEMSVINIGGGMSTPLARSFRVPYNHMSFRPEQIAEEFLSLLQKGKEDKNINLWAEPGRLIVEDSMILITEVRKVSRQPGMRYAVVRGGMHLVPTANHIRHPMKSIPKDNEVSEWVIFGSSCIEKDILSVNASLPRNLKEGDLVIIGGVGAYDIGMAYPFSDPLPPVVLHTKSGEFKALLHPGQSFYSF